MTTDQTLDYIIVGQGLAGSTLAMKLFQEGKRIMVIDSPQRNNASRIAAGLFNPITGRKMVKTWMADKLFPALHTYYDMVATLTRNSFFHPMPVYRPFISVEEQNEWMGKSSEGQFTSYVESIKTRSLDKTLNDPYGGLLLRDCGYLDTAYYLDAVNDFLRRNALAVDGTLEDDDLRVDVDIVRYGEFKARKVVFCCGTHLNKWFRWLPIRSLKGETITITTHLEAHQIINRGVYIVPGGGDNWRVGATYNYEDNTPQITETSRAELTTRLQDLIQIPFTIVNQEWGLRPTTPDRRPILGRHPELPTLWVFNGLGTKGVSLAPYFAEVLIRSMENARPVNKEVDIDRYKLLYWNSPR